MGFLLSPLGLKLIGGLIVVAVLAWVVNEAINEVEHRGEVKQLAKDQPVIDQLRADKTTLEANQAGLEAEIKRQNAAVADWQAEVAASQAEAKAAISRASATAKAYQSQIDALAAVATGPKALNFEQACQDADSLLKGLAQ